jgi:hypothetical protein
VSGLSVKYSDASTAGCVPTISPDFSGVIERAATTAHMSGVPEPRGAVATAPPVRPKALACLIRAKSLGCMTASSSVVQPRLQLRLPRVTHRRLVQLARARHLTLSAFVRQLLLEQLALVTGGGRRKTP